MLTGTKQITINNNNTIVLYGDEIDMNSINISKLVWLNVEPDDETYNTNESGNALNRLVSEENLKIDWVGEISDFGYGRNELFEVEGPQEVVDCVETLFYEKCNDEAEKSISTENECGFIVNETSVKKQIDAGDVHLKEFCENNYYFCSGCKYSIDRR